MEIKFKRNFKLVDNGDLTQNLHSLCYQNNRLISEADLGNVEDILYELKKQKEVIDRLKELNLTISDSDYIYSQDEITSKNLALLQMLEDKEV